MCHFLCFTRRFEVAWKLDKRSQHCSQSSNKKGKHSDFIVVFTSDFWRMSVYHSHDIVMKWLTSLILFLRSLWINFLKFVLFFNSIFLNLYFLCSLCMKPHCIGAKHDIVQVTCILWFIPDHKHNWIYNRILNPQIGRYKLSYINTPNQSKYRDQVEWHHQLPRVMKTKSPLSITHGGSAVVARSCLISRFKVYSGPWKATTRKRVFHLVKLQR